MVAGDSANAAITIRILSGIDVPHDQKLSGYYPDSIRAFKRRGAVGRGVVGATLHIWALTIRILSGYYPESRPQAAYPEHNLARWLQKTLLWCSGNYFLLSGMREGVAKESSRHQ